MKRQENTDLNTLKPLMLMIFTVLLAQGCSLFRDKPPEYLDSQDGQSLQVPDDLDDVRFVSPILITGQQLRMPSGDELNPGPPRAASTGGGDIDAFLAWSAEGVYLKVEDVPESVASRLAAVIEQAGMNMLEPAAVGTHRFAYTHERMDNRGFFEKMLFWRNEEEPDYSGTYRLRLEADRRDTRVFLLDETGGAVETGAAEHVLGIFMDRMD
jgi:uncharacterized lipoprotein